MGNIKKISIYGIVILLFLFIIFMLGYINVYKHSFYAGKLDDKQNKYISLASAPRGRILDRNGNILVDNIGVKTIVYKKSNSVKKTDEIEIAMENCLDASMDYIESIQKHDADVICVNEPTASPELIDPLQFKSMIKPNLEDLADFIDVQKVLHICGSTQPIISDMSSVGFDGISIEEAVDIPKAKESIEDECVIVGNISTSKTLLSGTPEDVKEDVKKVLSEDIDIIAPSCGLAPKTPLANVKALVEARNEYFNI